MLGQSKRLLEIVDFTHKAWECVIWIATVILPFIGPPLGITSQILARFIAAGAFVGGISGYYFTVSGYAGKGRTICMKWSAIYLLLVWLPFVLLVALLCTLKPQVTGWSNIAASLREFFIDFPFVQNLVSAIFSFALVSLLIGGITLRSPKLWKSGLDGLIGPAPRDESQRESARNSKQRQQEGPSAANTTPVDVSQTSTKSSPLVDLSPSDLAKLITQRMNRAEVVTVWHAVLKTRMDDDMGGRELRECAIELVERAHDRKKSLLLIQEIIKERHDLANL